MPHDISLATYEGFCAKVDVSRETFDRFVEFSALLAKWNKAINLVGKSTEVDIWQRHILDSAQLFPLLPEKTETLTDFGSGAGFPAMVLALMGVKNVHVIESDHRKAAFLIEASRLAPHKVHVHAKRVEQLTPWPSDVVTARAFAPMSQLLNYIFPFLAKNSLSLLMKGCNVEAELAVASQRWKLQYELYPSITEEDARIVVLHHINSKVPL